MQEETPAEKRRSDALERLRLMDLSRPPSGPADQDYQQARQSLEEALEEARTIRLQAIDDARATRQREMAALAESLRALRHAAEVEAQALIRTAEIQAERTRANADAVLAAAEERKREMDRIEAEFNAVAAAIAKRLGITEQPETGWWRRLRP
jgi:chromosome segregation ATPase